MGRVVLDSNVLIGYLQQADEHHAEATRLLDTIIAKGLRRSAPATVFSEILVHAARASDAGVVERFLERAQIDVVPFDRSVARRTAEVRARWPLKLPDAAVVATALELRADLETFDAELRHVWDRMSV